MTFKWFDVLLVVFVALIVWVARRDYRKGLLSERVVILWSFGALTGVVLAVVPELFVAMFKAMGVVSYPSAPITLAIMFLFVSIYGLSRKLGRTSQMLRRLAIRDAVAQVLRQSDRTY